MVFLFNKRKSYGNKSDYFGCRYGNTDEFIPSQSFTRNLRHPIDSNFIKTVEKAGIQDITVVVGPHMDNLKQAVAPYRTVEQTERLGTGHAVLMAQDYLKPFDGCVLILFGDSPLLKPETLSKMVQKYQEGFDVVVLGFIPQDARRYGRLVMSRSRIGRNCGI